MFRKLADFFKAYGYQIKESGAGRAQMSERTDCSEADRFFYFDQLNRNS